MGARKADDIVMLTWRLLHASRAAMASIVAVPVSISDSHCRPRAIALTSLLRTSARAMARQAEASLIAEFGLPLGLIIIDTVVISAGYPQSGAESDTAVTQTVMNVMKEVGQQLIVMYDFAKSASHRNGAQS
jgi:hypothetical protein